MVICCLEKRGKTSFRVKTEKSGSSGERPGGKYRVPDSQQWGADGRCLSRVFFAYYIITVKTMNRRFMVADM